MVAVSDTLAGDLAGATSYWQLTGGVDAAALRRAGFVNGIDVVNMPVDTTAKTALRRACADQVTKRTLSRSLTGGGWAIVGENAENGSLTHGVIVKCSLDTNNTLRIVDSQDNWVSANAAGTIAEKMAFAIVGAFNRSLATLDAADISAWLVATAERLNAVALRDRGGVYFVPKNALTEWRLIARVLRAVAPSCDVYELPTMRSDEAVRSIVAAVTREASDLAVDLIGKIADGSIGALALKRRGEDCDALCKKLEAYEGLLGASLDTVKNEIQAVQASCMAAALMATAESEANQAQAA